MEPISTQMLSGLSTSLFFSMRIRLNGKAKFDNIFTRMSVDFDVKVRFQSLKPVSVSPDITKAGLMVRESTNLDSRTLYASVNPPLSIGGRDQGEPGFRDVTAGATALWSGVGKPCGPAQRRKAAPRQGLQRSPQPIARLC